MMSQLVVVGISDYKIARGPDILVTYALGSCIGICLYDRDNKIGGLSHIMLPDSNMFSNQEVNRMKFADTAIEDLVQKMKCHGLCRSGLTAKIAGGAQMFDVQPGSKIGSIGERNLNSVKQVLSRLRIPILAESTRQNFGRTVYFNPGTGTMQVHSLNKIIMEL